MKKLIVLFAGLFMMTIAVQNVMADNPKADADADASATIIQVISISNEQALTFGNIIASAAGGTVAIATNGSPSYAGVDAPTGNEGTRQQAIFTVEGMGNATFDISLPSSITLTDGTYNMTVDNFVSNPDNTGTLSADGEQTLNVGATLNIGANQATGTYEGSFNVEVNYN